MIYNCLLKNYEPKIDYKFNFVVLATCCLAYQVWCESFREVTTLYSVCHMMFYFISGSWGGYKPWDWCVWSWKGFHWHCFDTFSPEASKVESCDGTYHYYGCCEVCSVMQRRYVWSLKIFVFHHSIYCFF